MWECSFKKKYHYGKLGNNWEISEYFIYILFIYNTATFLSRPEALEIWQSVHLYTLKTSAQLFPFCEL
jgi:hypothetical protein